MPFTQHNKGNDQVKAMAAQAKNRMTHKRLTRLGSILKSDYGREMVKELHAERGRNGDLRDALEDCLGAVDDTEMEGDILGIVSRALGWPAPAKPTYERPQRLSSQCDHEDQKIIHRTGHVLTVCFSCGKLLAAD